jgi:hypothetical protein
MRIRELDCVGVKPGQGDLWRLGGRLADGVGHRRIRTDGGVTFAVERDGKVLHVVRDPGRGSDRRAAVHLGDFTQDAIGRSEVTNRYGIRPVRCPGAAERRAVGDIVREVSRRAAPIEIVASRDREKDWRRRRRIDGCRIANVASHVIAHPEKVCLSARKPIAGGEGALKRDSSKHQATQHNRRDRHSDQQLRQCHTAGVMEACPRRFHLSGLFARHDGRRSE